MLNRSDLIGRIGIENAGHLPARKLGWFVNIKHNFSGEEPETFFQLESEKGNIVLAPGTVATRGSDKHVSVQALLIACEAPKAKGERALEVPLYMYVCGSVHYDDGYRRRRVTKFCHRYNWKNRGRDNVGGYEIAAMYARYHEHGNDAD